MSVVHMRVRQMRASARYAGSRIPQPSMDGKWGVVTEFVTDRRSRRASDKRRAGNFRDSTILWAERPPQRQTAGGEHDARYNRDAPPMAMIVGVRPERQQWKHPDPSELTSRQRDRHD